MFVLLSALSCSEDILDGLLVRSHCWLDSGQWRPYWRLLGACGQYCWVLIHQVWWVFSFPIVLFSLNVRINVRVCVCFYIDVLLCRFCTVEKDAEGLTSNVCYDKVIVFHVQESPGVSLLSLSSSTGVDHCRSCQQGFCYSRIYFTVCPTHLHILPLSTF